MQLESLSWFPGHMTKTRRMVASEIGSMDAVCEMIDARIPRASRNPDLDELTAGKPRIVVLNRVDRRIRRRRSSGRHGSARRAMRCWRSTPSPARA